LDFGFFALRFFDDFALARGRDAPSYRLSATSRCLPFGPAIVPAYTLLVVCYPTLLGLFRCKKQFAVVIFRLNNVQKMFLA